MEQKWNKQHQELKIKIIKSFKERWDKDFLHLKKLNLK